MTCKTSMSTILERILHDPSAEPTNLPLSLLRDITDDFSEDQKIGTGGFANVYKGSLQNGAVAVKKLSEKFMVDDKTFYQEVRSLIKVKHKNVVRFLGYCANTEEKICNYEGKNVFADIRQKMLCFEYFPKGSLDRYITDAQGLDWKTRYQILKGICEGLHYLHINRIVHLDLKPSNVLLNENMEPKISDFGLSRWLDEDQSLVMTSNFSGSFGYVAPERYNAEISFKSDLYSLGIIILEILTGRKGYTEVEDVLESWKTRFKASQGDKWLEHVRVCTEIGIKCIDSNPKRRPETQHIIETLDETERTYGFIEIDCSNSSATHDVTPISLNPKEVEAEEKPQSLMEIREEHLLNMYISHYLGFSRGKPIAAFLIYSCLLHWRSFEVERTGVFDRIIETIGSAIEIKFFGTGCVPICLVADSDYKLSQDYNDKLTYWISNSSTLLLLLQRTLKTTRAAGHTHRRSSAATFGRVFSGMWASPQSAGRASLERRLIGGLGDLRQVEAEAKSPAQLFKQQLTVLLEKMYQMTTDNLKEAISPLLDLCIMAPGTSRASLIKGSCSQANALPQQNLIAHWRSIVKILTNYLKVFKYNYVPSFLISKVFTQIFSFINVQLFNSLLLRRERCSYSNGEYVKAGLAELEQWCIYATEEYAGSSWEELEHIRQAVGFLVIHQKPNKSLKEIANDLSLA